MRSRVRFVLLVSLTLLTSGCAQLVPDGFGGLNGQANAWAHEMTQSNQLADNGSTGDGIRVAVVDTGIDADHPDFKDVTVTWRDFVNDRSEPYDDVGHGTHVSGLVVSQGTGGIQSPRVDGFAQGATLIHAKAIPADDDGGDAEDVANAIDWTVAKGAHVLVLSLGSEPGALNLGNQVEDAVNNAIEQGVIVVAAAGNAEGGNSGDACDVSSPATVPLVIATAAVNRDKDVARFSCSGGSGTGPLGVQEREHPNMKPEISAPGVQLVGPWPEGAGCAGEAASYCVLSGTSQAAPIVGGLIAKMLEENPGLKRGDSTTVEHVKKALRQTAEKVGFNGHHDRYGYGIIQAQEASDWLKDNDVEPSNGDGLPTIPPSLPP